MLPAIAAFSIQADARTRRAPLPIGILSGTKANMTDASENQMTLPDAAALATRQEVEHLFGQCLLRFQAFELLMKSKLEGHSVSGSIARPEDALTKQIGDTRRNTVRRRMIWNSRPNF